MPVLVRNLEIRNLWQHLLHIKNLTIPQFREIIMRLVPCHVDELIHFLWSGVAREILMEVIALFIRSWGPGYVL